MEGSQQAAALACVRGKPGCTDADVAAAIERPRYHALAVLSALALRGLVRKRGGGAGFPPAQWFAT